jgi:chemotaxis protein CheY-P-specific phosphatase CheC
MIELTEIELSTSKEIINIGLAKAADSLSFFMHEKILIRSIDFKIVQLKDNQYLNDEDNRKYFVLTTDVIGELKGICYLVFSEEEANRIYKMSLPESILNSEEGMKEMGPAILLEIDNIVSAAVITQFSNLLNFKIYGGVPRLEEKTMQAFKSEIISQTNAEDYMINFRAEFIASGENFNPQFIWLLNQKFFVGVKDFLENSENLKNLEKLKPITS